MFALRRLGWFAGLAALASGCSAQRTAAPPTAGRPETPIDAPQESASASPSLFPKGSIASLPRSTLRARRWDTGYFYNSAPNFPGQRVNEAAWSRLAFNYCGAPIDLYQHLVHARYWPDEAHATCAALADTGAMAKALRCGMKLAASLGTSAYVVGLPRAEDAERDGEQLTDLRTVTLMDLGAASLELPARSETPTARPGLSPFYCQGGAKEDPSRCTFAVARIGREDLWIYGGRSAVEAFGEDVSSKPSGETALRAKDLETAAKRVAHYRVAEVGFGASMNLAFITSLGVPGKFTGPIRSQGFSTQWRKVLTEKRVVYGFGDDMNAYGGSAEFHFRPFRPEDTEALLADVRSWQKSASAYVETLGPASPWTGEVPKVMEAYQDLLYGLGIRELRESTVERHGDFVVLRLPRRIAREEVGLVREAEAISLSWARASAEIVDAVLAQEAPAESLLERVGGATFAKAVRRPCSR